MIKSMTGFASLTRDVGETATVGVTIRTVNHRYLDLQLRLPSALAALESRVRALVSRHVARGRVELTIALQMRRAPAPNVELNEGFAQALSAALDRARDLQIVEGRMTPGDLMRYPQALTIRDAAEHEAPSEELQAHVETVVEEALVELARMREREGGFLRDDLESRRQLAGDLADRIERAAEEGRGETEERLGRRVQELRLDTQADAAAIAQEIVRLASRSDISEEVVRFRGHLSHWVTLADSPEPCGRKLDFLLQEMNREGNTIGAKAEGRGIPELIVALKAELEKMREQVQNVE
jgi:uncharacterized protein (TIGR00255 family)